jgi:hypothetical protein
MQLPRNKKGHGLSEVIGNGDCNAVSVFALYNIRGLDAQPSQAQCG